MTALGRRAFLAGSAALLAGCHRLARPPPPAHRMSDRARALLARAAEGIDPARAIDVHVHLAGLGTGGAGTWVSPKMRAPLPHPAAHFRFAVYATAAGVEDLSRADEQWEATLVRRARTSRPRRRHVILPFDLAHREDGTPDRDASEFHVSNDHALSVAARHPDLFLPACSIHPYRKDALAELERVAERGAVLVKWLPAAMRIDPSSPRCRAFYERMAALGLPLLTHAGEEKAVESDEAQHLGNPLLLRVPLDAGVKVIVAHCASLGESEDLDAPGRAVPNLDLFLRLAGDGRYRDRLWGELSALTQYNRCRALVPILLREELHDRLVDGSDYPLPAIDALLRTGTLEQLGLVDREERRLLNEVNRHNPLAFDLAVKRTVRIEAGGKTFRLPPRAFTAPRGLLPGV